MRLASWRADGKPKWGIIEADDAYDLGTVFYDRYPDLRSFLSAGAYEEARAAMGQARPCAAAGCEWLPRLGGRGGASGAPQPGATGRGRAGAVAVPESKPEIKRNEWNFVEIGVRDRSINGTINGVRIAGSGVLRAGGGVAELGDFGFLALRVAGGDVQFRNLALEDFEARLMPTGRVAPGFEMRRITDQFYAESAGIGDFNRDGKMDVTAGPFWYEGPDFRVAHEFTTGTTIATSSGYPEFGYTYVADFNGDGWPDILNQTITGGFALHLYLNPKGESRHWEKIVAAPATTSETVAVCDLLGDGHPAVIGITGGMTSGGVLTYFTPDASDVRKPWITHVVSEPALAPRSMRPGPSQHGMGCGDINGDGRKDIVNGNGWWEQPAQNTGQLWTFHPAPFDVLRDDDRRDGGGGAQMSVLDLNGDGRADVVTTLAGHGWGLAWFEQMKDGSWTRHLIMSEPMTAAANDETVPPISELHAMAMADLDGDGLPDIITGKRWWSHGDLFTEIGFQAPATLYWRRFTRMSVFLSHPGPSLRAFCAVRRWSLDRPAATLLRALPSPSQPPGWIGEAWVNVVFAELLAIELAPGPAGK